MRSGPVLAAPSARLATARICSALSTDRGPRDDLLTVRLAPSAATRRRLAEVALGREPADLVVAGGALVDVFTEEVLEGWGVAVAEGRVAYVGPDSASRAGPETEVVDAGGDLVMPGLVEAHSHTVRIGLPETARLQVAAGVTTTVLETSEVANVCGPKGLRLLLAQAAAAPGRVLLTVPPLVGIDPAHQARIPPAGEWVELLDLEGVIGVGELYWADLLRGHPRAEALIEAALARGLAVEGHGAGAREPALNALAALGWGDDHESIDAGDLTARLRLGLHALVRQGGTRQDLDALSGVWREAGVDLGRACLTTDGVEPGPLLGGESLNWVVEQAVGRGLPLARAVRLASRNPAERFGLGRWLGGLAPGMMADLTIVSWDGSRLRPRLTLLGGRRPQPGPEVPVPVSLLDTVRPGRLEPGMFAGPRPGDWRAMELVAPLVTAEARSDGSGALVACAVDRLGGSGFFAGLLIGYGLQGGAVATSGGWDSTSLLVVGDTPTDMAAAARRVAEMRGGAACAGGGRVLAQWRAPLAGALSLEPAERVASDLARLEGALRLLGCRLPNPLLTLDTLTSPAIPHLRITTAGYTRIKDGAALGLAW